MQTPTLKKTSTILDGFSSIYAFNQTVDIPYQNKNSVEKSLYSHWAAVGDYIQLAMNDFDYEQKIKHN